MPRIAVDYSKTVIYKIVCNDLSITELYVGSTTNFTERKFNHKSACKTKDYKIYNIIRANGNWENWSIIEIEKYPCADSNEARNRERYWVEELNARLNMNRPIRTIEEVKEQVAEYQVEYKQVNKEKIKEQNAKYRQANKEKMAEYYKNNKERIKEQKQNKIIK